MDTAEHNDRDTGIGQMYRVSWVAYIKPIFIFLVLSGIGLGFGPTYMIVAALLVGTATPLLIYQVLVLRSMYLYTDDDGVWFHSGVLPWKKGTAGVKWRDIEDAVYYTGFVSWLFNSHTIRIGHRFTKASEIIVPHVYNGKEAVAHVNGLHTRYISDSNEARALG